MMKQSRSDRISASNLKLLESTWTFKSPSRRVGGDMEQTEMSNSDGSDVKVMEALAEG